MDLCETHSVVGRWSLPERERGRDEFAKEKRHEHIRYRVLAFDKRWMVWTAGISLKLSGWTTKILHVAVPYL